MSIHLHKFYFDSLTRARVQQECYGQAMFNNLVKVRPDIAEQVRNTDMDPSRMSGPAEDYERWDRFIAHVESNWLALPLRDKNQAIQNLLREADKMLSFIGCSPEGIDQDIARAEALSARIGVELDS